MTFTMEKFRDAGTGELKEQEIKFTFFGIEPPNPLPSDSMGWPVTTRAAFFTCPLPGSGVWGGSPRHALMRATPPGRAFTDGSQ